MFGNPGRGQLLKNFRRPSAGGALYNNGETAILP